MLGGVEFISGMNVNKATGRAEGSFHKAVKYSKPIKKSAHSFKNEH